MLRKLARDYPYIHLGLGLAGNSMFVIGSILFFKQFEAWRTVAVWLFVIGSSLMWIGAAGRGVKEFDEFVRRRDGHCNGHAQG